MAEQACLKNLAEIDGSVVSRRVDHGVVDVDGPHALSQPRRPVPPAESQAVRFGPRFVELHLVAVR